MKIGSAADFVIRFRAAVVAAAFAVVCAAAVIVSRADFAENIYDAVPKSDAVIQSHIWANKIFNRADALFFDIEKSANAPAFADELAARLAKVDGVSRVSGAGASARFDPRILAYVPAVFDARTAESLSQKLTESALEERFLALKKAVLGNDYAAKFALKYDALGVFAAVAQNLKAHALPAGVSTEGARIVSASGGSYLVVAEGSFACSDSVRSARLVADVLEILGELKTRYPDVRASFAGGYRVAADNAAIAKADSFKCLWLTIAVMAVLCAFSFGNRVFALVAPLPSVFGSAVAFAVVCAFFPTVSAVSVAFAGIAIGVSIDYAIHVLSAIDARSGEYRAADARADFAGLARPIAVVSATTAAAFALMSCFGGSGFLQLGIFGVAGIFVSAAASLLLPALLSGMRLKKRARRTLPEMAGVALARFSQSKISLVVFVLLTVFAAANVSKVGFNGDLSSFNIRTDAARADYDCIRKNWGGVLGGKSVVLRAENFGALLAAKARLDAFFESRGIAVSGLQTALQPARIQRENAERWRAFFADSGLRSRAERACKKAGLNFERIYSAYEKNPEIVADAAAFAASPLAEAMRGCVRADGEVCALSASFEAPDGFDAPAFAAALAQAVPEASLIDAAYLGARIADISFDWLVKFAIAAFVFAGVYLFAVYGRSVRAVAAVLVPVAVGLFWSFGAMGFFGIQINIINSVFVVFAVCMAQDYAVFVFNGVRRGGGLARVFAPVFLSAATTVSAFGVLCVSKHPVINGLGAASAVSIFGIFLACACLAERISRYGKKS